jgi:hypothetical protein
MIQTLQSTPSTEEKHCKGQGFGSGSVLDPDQIRSGDPDPYSESGSRRAKITHKSKKIRNFMSWSDRWSLLRAEGLFCKLDVLYVGLGIGKL